MALKAYPKNDLFLINQHQIINSTAFRRLQFKTQVWPHPKNPHVRNRMIHSLEVMSIASKIAAALGLNVDLVIAIALGHDLGHTPFGHAGEGVISDRSNRPFFHSNFAVFLLTEIEKAIIATEVLEGIKNHSFGSNKIDFAPDGIQEIALVAWADKIAFVFGDFSDLHRTHCIQSPRLLNIYNIFNRLGKNREERIMTCMNSLITESKEKGFISFYESPEAMIFQELKNFMYNEIYSKKDERMNLTILNCVWDWIIGEKSFLNCSPAIIMAMMTDQEVQKIFEIKSTRRVLKLNDFGNFGLIEFLPEIRKASPKFVNSLI